MSKTYPIAGPTGIASVDAQTRKLQAEDAAHKAALAAKVKAAKPPTNTSVR